MVTSFLISSSQTVTWSMAARKSCTHLTWAEAKSKCGISSGGAKKNKEFLRKQDHGQLQAQKIISKHGGDESENRKLLKAYRKLDEKSAALAAQREKEREEKRAAAVQEVRPYDRAKQKCYELLQKLRAEDSCTSFQSCESSNEPTDGALLTKRLECRRLQMDEIIALEALLAAEDFALSSFTDLTELQEILDECAKDHRNAGKIAKENDVSFFILLDVDDTLHGSEEDFHLNCLMILQITLPPYYLNSDEEPSEVPLWSFRQVIVTDKNSFCSADKPLESLAWLDEERIKEAMSEFARNELLPYPCVYEVAFNWLSEHVFEYLNLHPHLLVRETNKAIPS